MVQHLVHLFAIAFLFIENLGAILGRQLYSNFTVLQVIAIVGIVLLFRQFLASTLSYVTTAVPHLLEALSGLHMNQIVYDAATPKAAIRPGPVAPDSEPLDTKVCKS